MSGLTRALRVALTFVVIAACSEALPPAGTTKPAVEDPWSPDTRPVSETCLARAKPAPPIEARFAYQSITSAPLKKLVEIVPQNGRLYVIERPGVIHYLSSDGKTAPVVLDISSKVVSGYDAGLLSMAFHPRFAQNGYVYLAYTVPYEGPPPENMIFQSVLARYQSKDGGLTIDPTTEKRLLVRDQPQENHHGNKVVFGNDGYLYFAVGDGGVIVGPPPNQSQDKFVLRGKLLRLDVDSGDPYGIPPTNPYAQGGGAPEVFAYGFRNPWRFSIDSATGDIFLGDVGAHDYEEVDRVVAGGNYGWPHKEAKSCYLTNPCDSAALGVIDPVAVHQHDGTVDGGSAVIGGVVYRGKGIPALTGKYVYADYVMSNWWSFDPSAKAPVPERIDRGLDRIGPSSIGLDEQGEIVVVTEEGRVYRVVAPPPTLPEISPQLRYSGCVDKDDPKIPVKGLFKYDVNAPQWMDGATAERYLSIPKDGVVKVGDRGTLELPPGSVAMRTLRKDSKLVETQFLLRRPDASWSAYAYAWSADQKDAVLQPERSKECLGCHDAHGHVTLGLEAGQLDRGGVDPHDAHSRLATLVHVGLIAAPVAPESYAILPVPDGYDTDERRSRAYLHANCAFCHDGQDKSKLDLRVTAQRPDAAACAILSSMRAKGPGHMPPIGATQPDETALRVLSSWIGSFKPCP